MSPYLKHAEQCFLFSRIILPARWRCNWDVAMWQNLLWAAESGEIRPSL